MILKFSFEIYLNANDLAFFIDFYAKKSNLTYSILKEENFIFLFVDATEEELIDFSENYISLVPNFSLLKSTKVEVVSSMKKSNIDIKNPKLSNITPFSIKEFFLHKKPIKNECGILSKVLIDDVVVDENNFNKFLDECFLKIIHNQSIKISVDGTNFILDPNFLDTKNDFLLPTSLKTLNKIFVNDENLLVLLASYEKPIITLKTNSIFRKNNPNAKLFFKLKAIKDLFIYALGQKLSEANIYFLGVKSDQKILEMGIAKNRVAIIYNKTNLKNNDELFDAIKNEFHIKKDDTIVKVFLSKNKDDEIVVFKDDKSFKQIDFKTYKNSSDIKKAIVLDDTSNKLFTNFSKEFGFDENLEFNMKKNFYSLLDVVSKILFKKDVSYLFSMANDFIMTKGLKIDCFINDRLEFDLARFLRTGMSYKLAGVDDRVLSFGYISSIAHFLSDYLDALKQEFDYLDAIFFGQLFEERALMEAFLRVSVNQNAKFSNKFLLEVL